MMNPLHVADVTVPARRPGVLIEKLHRPAAWMSTACTAFLVLWASMGSAGQSAPPLTPAEAAWQSYHAQGFRFSLPGDWTVTREEGAVYRLSPAGEAGGTGITLAYLPAPSPDLGGLERLGVAQVERDAAIARHYLRIMPRTRVAGRAAARVRYTADLVSGGRVEGIWTGVPLPDGRTLSIVLRVYPDAYFKAVYPVYKRFLQSVSLDG